MTQLLTLHPHSVSSGRYVPELHFLSPLHPVQLHSPENGTYTLKMTLSSSVKLFWKYFLNESKSSYTDSED